MAAGRGIVLAARRLRARKSSFMPKVYVLWRRTDAFFPCTAGPTGGREPHIEVNIMSIILLIVLLLLLLGALPSWPYSSGWGYYPSGGLGLVLVIVLVLFLMGQI
jgi:hypothetical protein